MNTGIEDKEIDYSTVGADERFAAPSTVAQERVIDDALGLQPISIRLQKDLLDNLKALALLNGLGYQPLIRQVLTRWVDCELKSMLKDKVAKERANALQASQLAQPAPVVEVQEPPQERLAA